MSILKANFVRLPVVMFLFIAGSFVSSSNVSAQDRGDRDQRERNDRDKRDDDQDERMARELRREKYRNDFDLKKYLDKLDDNKSGVLEKGELSSDRTRRYLSSMGINVSKSVPIDLAVRQAESFKSKKRESEREKFESKVGPKLDSFGTQQSPLGVTSFGSETKESPEVASFDERLSGLKQSDFDEKTLADARKILKGYDRDESGFLEGDEIGRIRWKDPRPTESDLNGDGRISLLEMAQRISNSSQKSRENDARRRDDRDEDRDKRERDKGRRGDDGGRGEGEGSRGNRGRNDKGGRGNREASKVPAASSGATSSNRGSESKTTSSVSSKPTKSSASKQQAYENYVANVFKKYDVDKDQKLSAAELKKMKRPFRGDANGDGFLSKDEAIDYIKGGQKSAKKSGQSTAAKTSERSDKPADRNASKPSSRQSLAASNDSKTPAKRGSLSEMDANSDGQIQMSEFSSTWDEDTLQAFRKSDADGDGILSPSEWAERTD